MMRANRTRAGFLSACLAAALGQAAAQTTKIKASDVVINGESFFAMANITSEMTRLARADGYIGAGESFRQIAVSGAVMTGILNQYKNCTPKPVYLIGDGGGNDLMGDCGANPTPECAAIKNALNTVRQYFTEMKNGGTKKVIWMRYPDPYGDRWATLKRNQDVYNPEVEKICKASVEPKCLWIDMRKTWEGKYPQYTGDGIHPTAAGGTATAEAFWKFAKENDFFNLGAVSVAPPADPGASAFRAQWAAGGTLFLSVSLPRQARVEARLADLAGRLVLDASAPAGLGETTLRVPLGALRAGVYRLDLRADGVRRQSALVVP